MTKHEFEIVLSDCCDILTNEANRASFTSSPQFESRVREVLDELTADDTSFSIDYAPHPQAFPDIAMGEFGVEVKFTMNDTWRSVANSVLETQRIESVKPEERISRWLEKADEIARDWKPSNSLFLGTK